MYRIDLNYLDILLKQGQPKVDDPIKQIIQGNIEASCSIFVHQGRQSWTGSGFHLGSGYIVTASHVCPPELMDGSGEIQISFDGKSKYSASIISSDLNSDIAIVFVDKIQEHVKSVQLGDSDTLEVGDIVAVIGSPEGWHDTATVGRISNVHQSLGEDAPSPAWNDIIFIDADILQGVSGGMVIGTDGLVYGSVMGVTGQLAQYGVGENSICPSNKIRALLQQIKSKM